MGVRTFKPYTPSRRNMTVSDQADITHKGNIRKKRLLWTDCRGRSSSGRIAFDSQSQAPLPYDRLQAWKDYVPVKVATFSMTQTAAHVLHFFIMLTERRHTSSPLRFEGW